MFCLPPANRHVRLVRSLNMRQFLLAQSRVFTRDDAGSVAVIFAIVAVALLLMAGAAIDFSRWGAERASMQAALDNTVMAAVKSNRTDSKYVNAVFRANFLVNSINENPAEAAPTVSCSTEESTLTCTASEPLPTTFIGMFSTVKKLPVHVTASAAGAGVAPSEISFTVTKVKGWYWKKVTVWVHNKGAAADTAVASIIYQPTSRTTTNGDEGTGTTCQQSAGQSSCTPCPKGSQCPTIKLGSDYDSGYLSMEMWTDGCDGSSLDQGYSNSPGDPPMTVKCTPVASKVNTISQFRSGVVDNYTLYTNKEPVKLASYGYTTWFNTPSHLFVDNVQLPLDPSGSMLSFLDCSKDVTHAWEDTLMGPTSDQSWKSQDFIFTVSTKCSPNSSVRQGTVRLTK